MKPATIWDSDTVFRVVDRDNGNSNLVRIELSGPFAEAMPHDPGLIVSEILTAMAETPHPSVGREEVEVDAQRLGGYPGQMGSPP